jgi:hypothetical protein
MQLTRAIFWDTRYETISWEKNASYVVDRVLHFGTLSDWHQVLAYYGREKVRDIVLKLRHLDKRVLAYCAAFFNTPKEQFRCYNTEPSVRQLWNS